MKLFSIASYRRWLLGVAVLSVLVWVGIYSVLYKGLFGFDFSCDSSKHETGNLIQQCLNNVEILHAFYFGYFLKSILLVSTLLMLFPERTFSWWGWFAIASIPLLTWWIIIEDAEFFGHLAASKASGIFFLVGSLLITVSATVYNHFNSRGQK